MVEYAKLGFKAGLEIHQQLDTSKLFCACPGYLRQDKPDYEVMRKLHAIQGETGEFDTAVEHEASKDKTFMYQGYHSSTCLVELDEEPPRPLNETALDEALKVALLLHCELYPCTQVMRKTVIDGSNTGGFQRTILVGHDGWIETKYGKVGIATVCLEEDSARPIERGAERVVYRLDRLGIPLVEIATTPDITHPEQIKEVALHIGDILRACNVKRGIGTIRQDINVSIAGHSRVEIKGFQEPSMMQVTAEKEIERQVQNIKIGKITGEVRGAQENGSTVFLRPMPGSARMYPETDVPLLFIGKERVDRLKKELPKLRSEVQTILQGKGVQAELIPLILDGQLEIFERLSKHFILDVNIIAKVLTVWMKEVVTKAGLSEEQVHIRLSDAILESMLTAVTRKQIAEHDIKRVMQELVGGKTLEQTMVAPIDDNQLEQTIRTLISEKPGLRANAYMGLVLAKLGSGVDKRRAMVLLQQLVGQ